MTHRGPYNRRGHIKGLKGPPPTFMPPHILMMFEPPPPLPFQAPPGRVNRSPYTGVSAFQDMFEKGSAPERVCSETPKQRHDRLRRESKKRNEEKVEEELKEWNPETNPKATGDAYKTLFVGRLAYETDEKKLQQEFSEYGPVQSVKIVTDNEGKSRGYGFVEFEDENDMRRAYKRADARRIDGRQIVVDVERGRTVRGWRPRRLGGGIGETRKGGKNESLQYEGREPIGTVAEIEARQKALATRGGFSGRVGYPPVRDNGFAGRYSHRGQYGPRDGFDGGRRGPPDRGFGRSRGRFEDRGSFRPDDRSRSRSHTHRHRSTSRSRSPRRSSSRRY